MCTHYRNYLGLLARSGKLEVQKWDRRWYAPLAALKRYETEAQVEPRGWPSCHQDRKD